MSPINCFSLFPGKPPNALAQLQPYIVFLSAILSKYADYRDVGL